MSDEISEQSEVKKIWDGDKVIGPESILHKGEDVNGNGILDDNELTEEQLKKKNSHRDIKRLYYFVYSFAVVLLIIKFVSFMFFNVLIDIDISKLANTLNIAIVFIGSAEGLRSFSKSAVKETGEKEPIPAYKLRELFSYLISFAVISIIAIAFSIIVNMVAKGNEELVNSTLPDFSTNDFTSGLLSNTLAYLIARYGDKVAEGIDLSSLSFFKKKM